MAAAMAREEGDALAGECAHYVVVRGLAKGSLDDDLLRRFKSRHGVEAATADNSDFRFQFRLLNKEYAPQRHRRHREKQPASFRSFLCASVGNLFNFRSPECS